MTKLGVNLFLVLMAAWVSPWGMAQQNLPAEIVAYPDLIFHNGKVLTADDSFTIAEAVAVRDAKILAVGENARIVAMKGPRTRVVDLQGRTLTPGFIDPHFHLHNYAFNWYVNGGINIYPAVMIADLEGKDTKDSLLRALRKKAQEVAPRDGWIILTDARGEDHGVLANTLFPSLTRQDVDEVFPMGQPAAVGASHGNNYSGYIVNSAGMKIALQRIPADTPGIEKDPQTGQPTGRLSGAAGSLFGRGILPWPDMKLVMQALEKVAPMYTAQGITMVQTKTPGYVMSALRELWWRGQMPIRWRANIDMPGDTEVAMQVLGNLTSLGDPWFRIVSGEGAIPRLFNDVTYQKPKPVPGARRQPPEEWPTYEERMAELERQDRPTDIFLAAKYGWSTSNVHNYGDMSADAYMSEIEKGLKERVIEAYGQQFALDHSLMLTRVTPQGNQFERIKKLGIVPSLKSNALLDPIPVGDDPNMPSDMSEMEILTAKFGTERVFQMLPAKSMIEAGLKPASEADRWYWPVSSPLWAMEKLITRKDDRFGRVWGTEERVNRQEALWMRTNWAARYFGIEGKEYGVIEPGRWADLVVLGQDYMTVPEDDISEIPIRMTVIGGKVVYDANRDQVPRPMRPYYE